MKGKNDSRGRLSFDHDKFGDIDQANLESHCCSLYKCSLQLVQIDDYFSPPVVGRCYAKKKFGGTGVNWRRWEGK